MDPIYYYLPDNQKINSYHLSRYIITLLNNQGGEIYVGMKDGDSISGAKTKKVQIEAICKKCISPYPKKAVAVLYIRNLPLKHVILIRVIGDSGTYKYSPYRKERLQDTIAKTNNETEDDSDMFRPKDSFSTLGTVFVKYFETSTETSVPMFEAFII